MKKVLVSIFALSLLIMLASFGIAKGDSEVINKVKITGEEIPEGFIFGKIPGFARRTLKDNPWLLDTTAVRKLTDRIYPGGNYNSIRDIHMTILTQSERPYGDDIVCYIIVFKDMSAAKTEIKKMTDFVGFNTDRAILMTKDNVAVFLHVDSTDNFHYITGLSGSIKPRLEGI